MKIETLQDLSFLLSMTVVITKPSERQVQQQVKAMREAARKLATSPDKGRSFLVKKGFVTKGNKLTRKYAA